MENERKPIFNGLISNGEYEATIVKVQEMPPTDRGVAAKVLFLIDNIVVNNVPHVYFVNGFFDKNYKSNSKASKLISAIGLENTGILPTKNGMVGKKCKLYVEAGPVKTNKFGQPVQYMQIKAVNPINRVVPNPVATLATPTQQPSFAQPVAQVAQTVQAPTPVAPVQVNIPAAQPSFMQPTVQQPVPSIPTAVPVQQPISTVPPVQSQPAPQPVPQAIPRPAPEQTVLPLNQPVVKPTYQAPAQVAQPVAVPQPTVAPKAVQQAEQPLPAVQPTYTSDDLDF